MKPSRLETSHTPEDAQAIRDHVLRAIAANRDPGFHFVGHFVDLRWLSTSRDAARLLLPDGAHVRDESGNIAFTALAIFVDTALSTATRSSIGAGERLATVYLQAQFTGARAQGAVVGDAIMGGRSVDTRGEYLVSVATLRADGVPICYATGNFARLDAPAGVELAPLPWQRETKTASSVAETTLTQAERAILKAGDDALARATPDAAFLRWFWSGTGARTATGASRRLAIGPHVSNRVGHVQGGILLGVAVATAADAAPAHMQLSNVSAWYVSPARGSALSARARVLHAGRNTALVRTQVHSEGRVAVEVMTQHVANAEPPTIA